MESGPGRGVSGRGMPLLYNAALAGASPALALLLARRLARGKSREGWGERWGRVESLPAPPGPRIWVHAASVGEVMAASPILQRVRGQLPAHDIVFSAITPGGHETARSSGLASHVFYAPFDVPWAVRRTIRAVRSGAVAAVRAAAARRAKSGTGASSGEADQDVFRAVTVDVSFPAARGGTQTLSLSVMLTDMSA